MKICCPNCSEVLESPVVPQEGQHLLCPFCNTKFLYSIRMSMLRYANKVDKETESIKIPNVEEIKIMSDSSTQTKKISRTLASCPDCGYLVSKRANSCPKCGAPIVGTGATAYERYNEELLRERNNKSEKDRFTYLLLAIFFGLFSVHNFYRGCIKVGVIRLILFFVCFSFFIIAYSGVFDFENWGAVSALIVIGVLVSIPISLSLVGFWIIDIFSRTDGEGKRMYFDR